MATLFGFDSAGGGGGGGGISDLNGLSDAIQFFAVGTSGADFNISSVSPTHTFNLPTASAVNRGALSSADWSTFNAKLSTAILSINGMTGTAQTINSGTSGTDLNIVSAGDITTVNIPDASTTARGLVTTGTQTFGGAKTFTQNSASALISNGTYTTLASGVAHAIVNPTMTLVNSFQASATALSINPTMVATANQQFFVGLNISGTYTGFGAGNNASRIVPINADGIFIAGGRTSTILVGTAGVGVIPSGFGAIHIGFDVGGGNSILIGRQAGLNGGSGGSILIGGRAGFQAGNGFIGIGGDVAFNVSTPTSSVIIGGGACFSNASGANATFFTNGVMIGGGARSFNNTDNNAIVIGTNAIGQGSNSVLLGDNSITKTFLKGDTAIGYAPTTASLTPNARLDVLGASAITGNAMIVYNSTPTELFRIENAGGIVVNETGLAVDFRVEGDTDPNTFLVQGSTNSVCVGTNTAIAGLTTQVGFYSGGSDSQLVGITDACVYVAYTDDTVVIGGTGYNNTNAFEVYKKGYFYADTTYDENINIQFGTTIGSNIATTNSQLFAFWGATPIAQPTTAITGATQVAGVGTSITQNDTFDGYTIAQVVKALRDVGLLA